MKGMRGLVVKAEAVDGVHGIKLDAAGVNKIGERADHSLPFQLQFIAGARGKTEDGRPPVAVNHDTQFDAEAVRVPAVIVALRGSCPSEANKVMMNWTEDAS